jgi:hypothetical protein
MNNKSAEIEHKCPTKVVAEISSAHIKTLLETNSPHKAVIETINLAYEEGWKAAKTNFQKETTE